VSPARSVFPFRYRFAVRFPTDLDQSLHDHLIETNINNDDKQAYETNMTSIAPRSFHQTLSPATSGAGHPLPFAPTLGDRPTSRPSAPGSRMATPLAAPPPPLNLTANPASTNLGRRVPFAGAEHTLGPTFSDEEDGDDSEWLANKMAVLGLNPQGAPYNSNNFAQRVSELWPAFDQSLMKERYSRTT